MQPRRPPFTIPPSPPRLPELPKPQMTTLEIEAPRRRPLVLLLALMLGGGGIALGVRSSAERPPPKLVSEDLEAKLFVPQALPAETLPWDAPASAGRAPPGRDAPASQARHGRAR